MSCFSPFFSPPNPPQFSKKFFDTFYTFVTPHIQATYPSLRIIFRQQVQPWHPSSTLTHEAALGVLKLSPASFWPYSAALFAQQTDFFDVNVVRETRNQTYRRLAELYRKIGGDAGVESLYGLLEVSDKPGKDGELNTGNKVMDDLKLLVRLGRQTGVHMSPTVLWDGVVEPTISSSWTPEQWEQFLKEKATV